MNCNKCNTATKHKNDVPTPLKKHAEEHIKKMPKNSLLSIFFRSFVVDLELGSEHRKQGPFPMHELKLNNPLRARFKRQSLNSENRPFSCQEMKLKNPMRA